MELLYAIAASPWAVTAILLFVYMSWAFLIALYLHDNSIVDIGYGLVETNIGQYFKGEYVILISGAVD